MSDPFARSSPSLESDMNSLLYNLLQGSFPQPHAPPPEIGPAGFDFTDPSIGFVANDRAYDIDDFDSDCKGAEVSEGPSDPTPRRSTKRARAAEVHNMSEKRRRSRINEKMKALQKLIPNSNKTDKASMLDEAIEYLKQLQLQVQMLSMRNGVSLYPYCSPLPQPGVVTEEHKLLTSREDEFTRNKEISFQVEFDTPNQCQQSNPPNFSYPITDIAEMSVRQHFQTPNDLVSSKDIYQGSQLQLDMKCSSSGVSS